MEKNLSISILRKLPLGKPLRFEKAINMDRVERDCVLWVFVDSLNVRQAYFDLETGEYVSEGMM